MTLTSFESQLRKACDSDDPLLPSRELEKQTSVFHRVDNRATKSLEKLKGSPMSLSTRKRREEEKQQEDGRQGGKEKREPGQKYEAALAPGP